MKRLSCLRHIRKPDLSFKEIDPFVVFGYQSPEHTALESIESQQ